MKGLREGMLTKHDPGWGMAVAGPVIVDSAELNHCPWPEFERHARVLNHALDVLLRDADGALRTSLHGMLVPCRRAEDNIQRARPHLESM